ncbi:hypothetical protein BDV98DRAFT_564216 [Pterulicium gracile]|uniref:NAD(P)-binding protein n=1 Tax=Pterulicium gracile TaxID=1884261 RepID=A0A5C3QSD1_9AGAR|nr:hypothetical protein BDV98DRAFT_564216 [Pterula gracilis]
MADAIFNRLTASNIFDLRGVVAVVTGGGSGIGLMITTTLVANGAKVYIVGLKQAELDQTAKVFNEAARSDPNRGEIVGVEGDVSSKSEAARIAKIIEEKEGYITVLFNNAAILEGSAKSFQGDSAEMAPTAAAFKEAFFDNVTPSHFTKTLNTNCVGPYWLTFAFLPLLENWKFNGPEETRKKFVPQVIMTSSMNGWTKDSSTGGYSYPYIFSKSAIGHFTGSLARELLPLGIRVNGIAPGWFQTAMATPSADRDEFDQVKDPAAQTRSFRVPTVSTGGTNRDVGSLALFLVANWYVNGETVLIDGGTMLEHPSSY